MAQVQGPGHMALSVHQVVEGGGHQTLGRLSPGGDFLPQPLVVGLPPEEGGSGVGVPLPGGFEAGHFPLGQVLGEPQGEALLLGLPQAVLPGQEGVAAQVHRPAVVEDGPLAQGALVLEAAFLDDPPGALVEAEVVHREQPQLFLTEGVVDHRGHGLGHVALAPAEVGQDVAQHLAAGHAGAAAVAVQADGAHRLAALLLLDAPQLVLLIRAEPVL